jgi:elongation factor Ts
MNAENIRKLREATGCGVMEARRGLEQAGGDLVRAIAAVRADQQSRRENTAAATGAVFQYRHHNGLLGSMVVLLCTTDFAARSEVFRKLGEDIALHVAALGPENLEALLEQPFVKDASRTLRQMVKEVAAQTGEAVQIREFHRCQV